MTGVPTALRDLGHWSGGGTPAKSRSDFWNGGDIPWLSPKDMGAPVLAGTRDHVTQAALRGSSARLIEAGSVAVVTRSGILERTLPVAVVPFATTLNQDMKALTPAPGVEASYVAWALRAVEQQLLGDTRKAGTTVASIEWPRFLNFKIPMRPPREQRRIVEVIEEHLSHLDAADAALTLASRRLTCMARRAYDHSVRDVTVAMEPLLSVASIANGQTPKALGACLVNARREGDIPFFKVGDMNAGDGKTMGASRTFVSLDDAARIGLHVRPTGTVLLPKRGGAISTNKKRLLDEPAAYDMNTMGLICSGRLIPAYLWHWLQTVDLGQLADGSNVPQINAPQIRTLILPVPSPGDQERVVASCDTILGQVKRTATDLETQSARTAALRRAVLAAAFAGRLTGSGSDTETIEEFVETRA